MSWVPLAIGGWLLLSVAAALVIGFSIRLADRRARETADTPNVALEQPPPPAQEDVPAPPPPRHPGPPAGHTQPPVARTPRVTTSNRGGVHPVRRAPVTTSLRGVGSRHRRG